MLESKDHRQIFGNLHISSKPHVHQDSRSKSGTSKYRKRKVEKPVYVAKKSEQNTYASIVAQKQALRKQRSAMSLKESVVEG